MAATDVMKQVYDAFAAGDGEALGRFLGDTDWIEATGGPYGGRYRGLGEIGPKVFGAIARDVQNFTAVPDDILAIGDDRALALGLYRGTTAAGPLLIRFAHLATVDGERITHFEQFTDTHEWRGAVGA